jgi:hypothetical protein
VTTDDRTETSTSETPMGDPIDTALALTERERAIIEFEGSWWMQDEARDAIIRSRFQCSSEDYYQELNQLLDHPGALTFDPLVVRRLRRQRERRRRARLDGPGNVGTATGHQTGQQGGKG